MSYKDIMVFLDGSIASEARLHYALVLARANRARLTAVDINTPAAFDSEWGRRAVALPGLFAAKANAHGVTAQYRITDRSAPGTEHLMAHYADLLIAPQQTPDNAGLIFPAIPEDVLVASGVPTLVLPNQLRDKYKAENVVIAWSPSAQATRAVHAAVPILSQAKKVTIFAFEPAGERSSEANALQQHLTAYNVHSEIEHWSNASDLSVIEALFASQAMEDADMIVAGAYSHSRVREAIFGGVTKDLLHQISIPVFVSH